jgi:hypothetical protein
MLLANQCILGFPLKNPLFFNRILQRRSIPT